METNYCHSFGFRPYTAEEYVARNRFRDNEYDVATDKRLDGIRPNEDKIRYFFELIHKMPVSPQELDIYTLIRDETPEGVGRLSLASIEDVIIGLATPS